MRTRSHNLVNRLGPIAGAVAVLLLASCGGDDPEAADPPTSESPSPSSTVNVPDGVTLTPGGEELSFGDTAVVVFEPTQKRGTALELTVDGAAEGTLDDFSGFILEDDVKTSTPYYVDVSVKNVGETDVGGFAIPLFGVDATDLLLRASVFTTEFDRCPSEELPDKFAPEDTFKTCLVYLAPKRGTLEAVRFSPTDFDPITWTGEITEPEPPKKN